MTSQKYTILYGRLSQDDGKAVESNSVTNQRLMLERYALDNGFENVLFLADDGYTGTNFERPSWKQVEERSSAARWRRHLSRISAASAESICRWAITLSCSSRTWACGS